MTLTLHTTKLICGSTLSTLARLELDERLSEGNIHFLQNSANLLGELIESGEAFSTSQTTKALAEKMKLFPIVMEILGYDSRLSEARNEIPSVIAKLQGLRDTVNMLLGGASLAEGKIEELERFFKSFSRRLQGLIWSEQERRGPLTTLA